MVAKHREPAVPAPVKQRFRLPLRVVQPCPQHVNRLISGTIGEQAPHLQACARWQRPIRPVVRDHCDLVAPPSVALLAFSMTTADNQVIEEIVDNSASGISSPHLQTIVKDHKRAWIHGVQRDLGPDLAEVNVQPALSVQFTGWSEAWVTRVH